MPQTIFNQDFTAGWTPTDDLFSGRKNGWASSINLDLDKNNGLRLTGGAVKLLPAYGPTTVRNLYPTYHGTTRTDYAVDDQGNIYRNRALIASGIAPVKRAGFGEAFNFTLVTAGPRRIKDNGTTASELGINKAATAPVVEVKLDYTNPPLAMGLTWTLITATGNAVPTGTEVLLSTVSPAFTVSAEGTDIQDANFQDFIGAAGTPKVNDTDPTDKIGMYFIPTAGNISAVKSITIRFLLQQPTGSGAVSDLYAYTFNRDDRDFNIVQNNTGGFYMLIPRSAFTRFGSTTGLSWQHVHGIRLSMDTDSAVTVNVGFAYGSELVPGRFYGGPYGVGPNPNEYDYMQVNVAKNGSYVGKSQAGPATHIVIQDQVKHYTNVTVNTTVDTGVNEIWLFRRGGGLDQYYRVGVTTPAVPIITDQMTDDEAFFLNITHNTGLIAPFFGNIADDILAIVGPMEGRWFYFTKDFIYPTDINNPDLVDPGKAIRINGSDAETFLWAQKVAVATILVATTKDNYVLSGTFQTYPDFSVDIYYRPLGIKHPPVAWQVAQDNGTCYSVAADGVRGYDANGGDVNLSIPNTDVLFQGNTDPGEVSIFTPGLPPGSYNYPIAIGGTKLYVNTLSFIQVYDLRRNYWYLLFYNDLKGANAELAYAIATLPSGIVTGVFSVGNTQYDFDTHTVHTIDGAPIAARLDTVFYCNNQPQNRKDALTFKIQLLTGAGENLAISVKTDDGVVTSLGNVTWDGTAIPIEAKEQYLDASFLPVSKWYKFAFSGNFTQLQISNFGLDYEPRPAPLTHLIIRPNNFGSPSQKRVRTWPHVIDTMGNNTTFTPSVDNVNITPETFTSNYKKTYVYKFIEDAFGIDYGGVFHGGPFEYWGEGVENTGVNMLGGPPVIVEILPPAVRFDQMGPEELARYGKIMQFDLRLLSKGLTLPWKLYFNDNTMATGEIECRINEEWSYNISMPKGIGGHIVRIELGPTTFDFHRYYIRVLCSRSGGDSQNEWITLGVKTKT